MTDQLEKSHSKKNVVMHKIKKNVLQGAEDQGSEGDEEDKDEDYHMQATNYVN